MSTQVLSAAEQYARLKADRFEAFIEASFSNEALKGVDLYEVKTPSGMTFKCRRLDAAFAANTGQMPMALTESLITQSRQSDTELAGRFNEMSDIEKRANLQATAAMVRYVCVEPRLVIGEVGDQKDAISVALLTMDDFRILVEWAKGGDAASGLKTFRRKRK